MSSSFSTERLAVVGLGLMGASLAQALRPHADHIIAMDLDENTRQYALDTGIADEVTDDLYTCVHDAETVILAAPVRVIVDLLRKRLGSYLRSNTLLIDIGSTKSDICAAMGQLPIGINAIGGHPMTGKERPGIWNASADMYEGQPFVLCTTRRTTPATRVRALNFVRTLGAVPIEMEAERHDRIVAGISHLPYILSASLVATVAQEAQKDDALWELAAGGFRDMSRLSGSDIKMMSDILSTNTRAVATLLAMFRVQLAQMEAMLIAGDHERLVENLLAVRGARLEWMESYEQRRNGHAHDQAGQSPARADARTGG